MDQDAFTIRGARHRGFNLGGALVAAQAPEAPETGILAVVDGRVFPVRAVREKTELGRIDA